MGLRGSPLDSTFGWILRSKKARPSVPHSDVIGMALHVQKLGPRRFPRAVTLTPRQEHRSPTSYTRDFFRTFDAKSTTSGVR